MRHKAAKRKWLCRPPASSPALSPGHPVQAAAVQRALHLLVQVTLRHVRQNHDVSADRQAVCG